jgi:hypothetical protein
VARGNEAEQHDSEHEQEAAHEAHSVARED